MPEVRLSPQRSGRCTYDPSLCHFVVASVDVTTVLTPVRSEPPSGLALSRRRLIVAAMALLVAVLGVSAVVGLVSAKAHERFDWEVASIFGTALGTTALAAFTGALAVSTSDDVRATWELARLTRDDQSARERPLVVLHHVVFHGNTDGLWVSVDVANVGLGPALDLRLDGHVGSGAGFAVGGFRWPVVSAGERVAVALPTDFSGYLDTNVVAALNRDFPPTITGTHSDRRREMIYDVVTEMGIARPIPPSSAAGSQ